MDPKTEDTVHPHSWLGLLPVTACAFVIGAHLLLLKKSRSHRLAPERLADYWIILAYSLTFWFYAFDCVRDFTA